MAVDAEELHLSYYAEEETNNYEPDTSDESEAEKVDYGEWRWDPEKYNWYWVYYDDEAATSSDEEGNAEEQEAQDSSEDEEEIAWEPREDEADDEQSSAEWDDGEAYAAEGSNNRTSPRASKDQTLIVFDWDDTILPPSYLHQHLGGDATAADFPRSLARDMNLLEAQLIELLRAARALGEVKIITNAGAGWAESSCESFLPELHSFLVRYDVPIISARSRFEDEYDGDMWQYKTAAFEQEARRMSFGDYTAAARFVSVGDSEFEHHAARTLKGVLPEECIKIVKLNDDGSPESLRRQLETLHEYLHGIVQGEEHLDRYVQNIG